jgi:hypothetical protein
MDFETSKQAGIQGGGAIIHTLGGSLA